MGAVLLMILMNSWRLLVWFSLVILQSIFQLWISFRRWIIFQMINSACGWVNFSSMNTSKTLFWRDIKEKIAVSSWFINIGISIVKIRFIATGNRSCWIDNFRPTLERSLIFDIRVIQRTLEACHLLLHCFGLLESSRKVQENPTFRLNLCDQFKFCLYLFFTRWTSGGSFFRRSCFCTTLSSCFWRICSCSISGFELSKLLEELLFFCNILLNFLYLSLFRFVS